MNKPVLLQLIANGRGDEVTVLLQLVQGLLHRLVNALLYCFTHLVDLIHAPARLGKDGKRAKHCVNIPPQK